MRIWNIYQDIKKKTGIEKVTPENISKIREILSTFSPSETAEKYGVKNPRSQKYLDLILFRFLKNPTLRQKAVLYYLFKESNIPTSLNAVYRKLGFGTPYSCQPFLSAKILEDMGLIRLKIVYRGYHRYSIIAVYRQRFKEYWPDIEDWDSIKIDKKERPIKKRIKKGEQIRRAFLIINDELRESGGKFNPEVVETIRGLNRGDFRERGWEISPRYLTKLKKRLLRMPIASFISHLKQAEESRPFLF